MPTITITVDTAQAQRLAHAFGRAYGLQRDATAPEVKQFVINYMKGIMLDQESAEARAALAPPADLDAT